MRRNIVVSEGILDQQRVEDRFGVWSGFNLTLLCIVAVFAWGLFWFFPTAHDIASIWWRSETYAHGLVVLPVFAWLVWRQRERIATLSPTPAPWMLLPVAVFGGLWLLGMLAGVAAASHAGFVLMLISALIGVLGRQISLALMFPIGFLLFAIPIGDFMLPTLMHLTAEFTVGALRLSGVPVYQDGLHFVIPNGRWSVVEACSGIRYLIASVLVGALYAHLNYASLRKKLLFMAVSVIVPIVANWARAYMIVMLGYLSDNEIATGVDHLIYGWIFFGVIIMLMFMIGQRWADDPDVVLHRGRSFQPVPHERGRGWVVVVPLAMLMAAFAPLHGRLDLSDVPVQVTLDVPQPADGWKRVESVPPLFKPAYAGYKVAIDALYRSPAGGEVGLFAAAYAHQAQGREMIAWGNGLIPPGEDATMRAISSGSGETVLGSVKQAVVGNGHGRWAALTWYVVEGEIMASDARVKLRLGLNRLFGRSDTSVVVVLSARDDEHGGGLAMLRAFVTDHQASLRELAVSTRPGAAP